MGWTSENVAAEFNVTREEQDAFAAESFQKAERAQREDILGRRSSHSLYSRKILRLEKNIRLL